MSYSSYDHDDLEPASTMRIERRIYFESGKADLSEMVKLPLAELLSLRAESAAAEQEVFDRLKEQAAAWEEQAGRTLFLDKALEYARTLPVTHTANQWEAPDEYRHIRSNMVYQMDYSISENTRYDSAPKNPFPTRGRSAGAFIPTRPTETSGKRSPDRIGKSLPAGKNWTST